MVHCIHCTLNCAGGSVVHSYGRLIPHEFPITDLQQISGPDGIGSINCTVSSGTARFFTNGGQLETGGVSQIRNRATATLVVSPSNLDSFQNRGLYCKDSVASSSFLYLFISSSSEYSWHGIGINAYNQESAEVKTSRQFRHGGFLPIFAFWKVLGII